MGSNTIGSTPTRRRDWTVREERSDPVDARRKHSLFIAGRHVGSKIPAAEQALVDQYVRLGQKSGPPIDSLPGECPARSHERFVECT